MTTTLFFGIVNDVWFSFNIIEKIQYTYSTLPVEELTDGTRFSYNYPTSGWKDQLLKFNNENFVYDNLGNPTTYRDKTLTWKYGRQLASFENITYKYNADGIRISKTNADNITTHFYLDGTKILAQDNGNLLTFKYGIDGVIGFTYQGVGDFYYKKNIFGDIIGIIDKNGQEIAKYTYDAWGNHKSYALNNGSFVDISLETSYTQDGLNNKLIAEFNPFRYRGYYYDFETSLYYLNSRYYDPEIGRFVNADDVSNLSPMEMNGLNLYAYCINNPVNLSDQCGHAWWHWLVGALVVIGAAITVVATAGGALAGMAAVAAVAAGGTAATMGATIAAAVFIGAVTSFTAMAVVAGIDSIGTLSNGGSFGDALNTFAGYGEVSMWSTLTAGVLGGIGGYSQYKIDNTFSGTHTPGKSTPYSTYIENGNYKKVTHYNGNGYMSWSKHYTTHNFQGHNNPHWHLEDSINHNHSKPINSVFKFIIEFIKRLFK